MQVRDPTVWMWGEALEMIERADRLHRRFFQLGAAGQSRPTWEPPVDVFETARQFIIVVALPGVAAEQLQIDIDGHAILVRGQRRQPPAAAAGLIHRLELPYGHFERRIELPGRMLRLGARVLADGCLTLTLDKLEGAP
ncbi:Hsp20/alpha crystallin family protein [Massilia solisilvae]|uniref:Hsp20/alpha crystallin family protein n=1 Tax=Massilia solisilvae TaxID=1811225 RepID=A0ABT2BGW1_9BURK|nr:Hsp20/alpha crystallin family protein [Massilia solisilvae]MCS0607752.1 Hsp20/alpha crystallin family protein [Massilia solisilvae]